MKMEGHILAVEDIGGEIKVTAQVCEVTAPDGTYLKEMTFRVLDRGRVSDVYRVGRDITVEIKVGK